MVDLGAATRDWVSERTDYPQHVAQLALAHEADGGVVNVHFDWRPKNNGRRVLRAAIDNVTPMLLIGTKRTCRGGPTTSDLEGTTDVPCKQGYFRV
jgi:hypothetical protein